MPFRISRHNSTLVSTSIRSKSCRPVLQKVALWTQQQKVTSLSMSHHCLTIWQPNSPDFSITLKTRRLKKSDLTVNCKMRESICTNKQELWWSSGKKFLKPITRGIKWCKHWRLGARKFKKRFLSSVLLKSVGSNLNSQIDEQKRTFAASKINFEIPSNRIPNYAAKSPTKTKRESRQMQRLKVWRKDLPICGSWAVRRLGNCKNSWLLPRSLMMCKERLPIMPSASNNFNKTTKSCRKTCVTYLICKMGHAPSRLSYKST